MSWSRLPACNNVGHVDTCPMNSRHRSPEAKEAEPKETVGKSQSRRDGEKQAKAEPNDRPAAKGSGTRVRKASESGGRTTTVDTGQTATASSRVSAAPTVRRMARQL